MKLIHILHILKTISRLAIPLFFTSSRSDTIPKAEQSHSIPNQPGSPLSTSTRPSRSTERQYQTPLQFLSTPAQS